MNKRKFFPRKGDYQQKPRKSDVQPTRTAPKITEVSNRTVCSGISNILQALKNSLRFRPGISFDGHIEKVRVQKGKETVVSFHSVSHIPIKAVIGAGTRRGNVPTDICFKSEVPEKPGNYKIKNLRFEHDSKTGTVSILSTPETCWHKIPA